MLNASVMKQNNCFDKKEQNMISGFIKLENELVRTSNALQTTLLNCKNHIQEMHHDNTMVAIQAKEYIEESQASHKRNHAFQLLLVFCGVFLYT